jgi:hypothetical protein
MHKTHVHTGDDELRSIRPAVVVWIALMAATTLSWWLGDGHGAAKAASVAVFVVAFTKVFFVGERFMELRHADPLLRGVFAGWCALMCAVLVALYLFA